MIAVDVLLYKIDQKLNKLASNEHQNIQLEDKILALNEAQIQLIKNKVDENRAFRLQKNQKHQPQSESQVKQTALGELYYTLFL